MSAPVPDEAVRLVDDYAEKISAAESLSAGTPSGAYLSKTGIAAQEKESDARAALLAYIAGVVKGRDDARAEQIRSFYASTHREAELAIAERDRLRDELEQARKDAERYRWLALHVVGSEDNEFEIDIALDCGSGEFDTDAKIKAALDAAIDAALAGAREDKP